MKQTAVEWLWEELDKTIPYQNIKVSQIFNGIIEQAKEMEKQQIVDSFEKGYENGAGVSDEDPIYHGGNYYNKTFK